MRGLIPRNLAAEINRRLQHIPVVAILGPRQCGKTTLALQIVKPLKKYLSGDRWLSTLKNHSKNPSSYFEIPLNFYLLAPVLLLDTQNAKSYVSYYEYFGLMIYRKIA